MFSCFLELTHPSVLLPTSYELPLHSPFLPVVVCHSAIVFHSAIVCHSAILPWGHSVQDIFCSKKYDVTHSKCSAPLQLQPAPQFIFLAAINAKTCLFHSYIFSTAHLRIDLNLKQLCALWRRIWYFSVLGHHRII